MGLKISLGACAVLLIAALFNYGQWQSTKVKLVAAEAEVSALKHTNEQQQQTITQVNQISAASAENVATMIKNNQAVDEKLQNALSEISFLRQTAKVQAYESPYKYGNDATDRRKRLLMPVLPASQKD